MESFLTPIALVTPLPCAVPFRQKPGRARSALCSGAIHGLPTHSNLTYIRLERDFITHLMQQHAITNCTPAAADLASVLAMLQERRCRWLHISTHGNFHHDNPHQDAVLELDGRQYLTPHDFTGRAIKAHLYDARPGFVFNACHSSRQGWALTHMGGWAQRLLSLGAGLFLAPLWAVSDYMALAFAQEFYTALAVGATASDALYTGRLAAYRADDPTWLAYSLYAHPNAQVQFSNAD